MIMDVSTDASLVTCPAPDTVATTRSLLPVRLGDGIKTLVRMAMGVRLRTFPAGAIVPFAVGAGVMTRPKPVDMVAETTVPTTVPQLAGHSTIGPIAVSTTVMAGPRLTMVVSVVLVGLARLRGTQTLPPVGPPFRCPIPGLVVRTGMERTRAVIAGGFDRLDPFSYECYIKYQCTFVL